MSSESLAAKAPELVFGVFRYLPQQRLLYIGDTRVHMGSRAREILALLVERAGEIVSKNDILARVWPKACVEEGTLRVHIVGLRKALNDQKDGACFIENVTGVGYRFVAPVFHASRPPSASEALLLNTEAGVANGGELRELEQLRNENLRLRRMVSDLMLRVTPQQSHTNIPFRARRDLRNLTPF